MGKILGDSLYLLKTKPYWTLYKKYDKRSLTVILSTKVKFLLPLSLFIWLGGGGGGLSDSEAWRDVTPVVQCVPDPLELLALVGVWQGDDIFPPLLLLCRAARAASSPVDWNQTFTYLTSICTSVLIHC